MAEPRVVLAADDPALSQQIQNHLRDHAGIAVHAGAMTAILDQITCNCDGLLLLAVANPNEQALARQIVQQLVLQRWPVRTVVLDALGAASRLGAIDLYVSRRLSWPTDAYRLAFLIGDLDRGRHFQFALAEDIESLLSQRLLALTPSLLPLVERIALAASHDVTVLINGETGTGKTYLARLVHDYSPRRHHRFLTISCGAIAANLIESEFFGHVIRFVHRRRPNENR
ncbi:MAG: hypothetical protein EXS16_03565 [Gemmataceae bacterium]|nr:hypothetical protein [Gemmataceae bacterium]